MRDKEKHREAVRRWKLRNPEKIRQYAIRNKRKLNKKSREWNLAHPEIVSERARRWRMEHPDKVRLAVEKYKGKNPERVKELQGKYRRERRLKVLTHYSNGIPKCACCGESTLEFLCLDHINGNGNKERKAMGTPNGTEIYQKVINLGFPKGFQILCYNCNNAKGHYGKCPHQKI